MRSGAANGSRRHAGSGSRVRDYGAGVAKPALISCSLLLFHMPAAPFVSIRIPAIVVRRIRASRTAYSTDVTPDSSRRKRSRDRMARGPGQRVCSHSMNLVSKRSTRRGQARRVSADSTGKVSATAAAGATGILGTAGRFRFASPVQDLRGSGGPRVERSDLDERLPRFVELEGRRQPDLVHDRVDDERVGERLLRM